MIGWVEFPHHSGAMTAVLGDDGRWTCDDRPAVAERLNRDFAPPRPAQDEMWGHEQLIAAAAHLGGIAWLGPDPSRP